MENPKTYIKKLLVFLLVITVVGTAFNPAQPVSAAKAGDTATVSKAYVGEVLTAGSYRYQILTIAGKKSRVSCIGLKPASKKKVTKATIPATVKIKSNSGKNKGTYSYKVTEIADNAFSGNKKLQSVSLGKNVLTIGASAFQKCSALKKLVINEKLKTISDRAFLGDKKLSTVELPPKNNIKTIGTDAFKDTKFSDLSYFFGSQTGENTNDSESKTTDSDSQENNTKPDPKDYSYEIIPLATPFNEWFYIKTDNPDPATFCFRDLKTSNWYKSNTNRGIYCVKDIYSDVVYENKETSRVKGGYLAYGGGLVDGGELTLRTKNSQGSFENTDVTVTIPECHNLYDYLYLTYGSDSYSFFENMSSIQKGLEEECLYCGVVLRGNTIRAQNVYYGISSSPHKDQSLLIQDPYYREDDKPLLVSLLYPYKYDSLAFPATLSTIARRLNSHVQIQQDSNYHYYINITLNGETQKFGGAGQGMNQGFDTVKAINQDQMLYQYRFDGSADDAAIKTSHTEIFQMLKDYAKLDNTDVAKTLPPLTWDDVLQTVGFDGGYIRIILLTSIYMPSASTKGYAYVIAMTNNYKTFSSLALSNAWCDGRYFNSYEFFQPGAKFDETLEQEPKIVLTHAKIPLPSGDAEFYYNGSTKVDETMYDFSTGIWRLPVTYYYYPKEGVWKAIPFLHSLYQKDSNGFNVCNDPDFIDACTLTMDEVRTMNLDANTDKMPESYYNYDCTEEPGTYHSGE